MVFAECSQEEAEAREGRQVQEEGIQVLRVIGAHKRDGCMVCCIRILAVL